MNNSNVRWFFVFFLSVVNLFGENLSESNINLKDINKAKYNFIRPYLTDWFVDLLPSDRGIAKILNENIKNLIGTDTTFQVIYNFIPNTERCKPDVALYFQEIPKQPVLGIRYINKSYYLTYDEESNNYITNTDELTYLPTTIPEDKCRLLTPKDFFYEDNIDMNGDGLSDIIQIGDRNNTESKDYPPWVQTNINKKFYELNVLINTGFGYVSEKNLSNFIYNFRLGYISGYYLGFNKSLDLDNNDIIYPSNTTLSSYSYSATSNETSTLTQDQPITQELEFDRNYVCSNFEDLKNRKFIDAKNNQILMIGLKTGYKNGEYDGKSINRISAKLSSVNQALKSCNQKNFNDTIIYNNTLVDYNSEITKFTYELLELPLYRITLKNKKTGITLPLIEILKTQDINLSSLTTLSISNINFVNKINRDIDLGSAPFFKQIDSTNDWYVCNPSILTGQVSAYLSMLTIVNNPDFRSKIKTDNDNGIFWNKLRSDSYKYLKTYSRDQIINISASLPGIFALEFREGFRNISQYIDKANSEISKEDGREIATKEIMDFLKEQFPDFKPGNVSSPAEAKIEIAKFIKNLYVVIKNLENTIGKLNNQIDQLNSTNQLLQQTISNTNNRVQELQGVIAKLNSAAGNLNRVLNVVANTAEVAYWGSSIGVTYTAGKAIVSGAKKLRKKF